MGKVFSKHPILIEWEKQKKETAFKDHALFEHAHLGVRINPKKNESILEISTKSIASFLAKKTQPNGRIFVVQNDINSIRKVIANTSKIGALNVEPILIENYLKIPKLPIESNSIDKVVLVEIFSRIEKNKKSAIEEISRVLKKNSQIIIVDVMKKTGLEKFLTNFIYPISKGIYKIEALNDTELKELSQKAKLEYVSSRLEYVPLIFENHKQMLEFFKEYYKVDCSDSSLLRAVHEFMGFLRINNFFIVNKELYFVHFIKK